MRVVLDANVFISGLLSKTGPPGKILDAWLLEKFDLVVSPQIVDELRRVFTYPRIAKRLEPGQVEMLIGFIHRTCVWTEGTLKLDVLTQDPSDNHYLSCAVEAKAMFLVTGNMEHFQEAGNPFRSVRILKPRQYLDLMESI